MRTLTSDGAVMVGVRSERSLSSARCLLVLFSSNNSVLLPVATRSPYFEPVHIWPNYIFSRTK